MTASAGSRKAASAIAAAVLRALGSTMIAAPAAASSCPSTCSRCALPVTTTGAPKRPLTGHRASVASNKVVSPTRGRKGLGLLARLRGQRRVPLPPQRITGIISVIDAFVISQLRNLNELAAGIVPFLRNL